MKAHPRQPGEEPPLNGPYEWFPSRRVAEILAYRRRFWPKEPFPFKSHRALAEVFASAPPNEVA